MKFIITALLLSSTLAFSEEYSLICIEETAAGMNYNVKTRSWKSATFKPSLKFIVRKNKFGTSVGPHGQDYSDMRCVTSEFDDNELVCTNSSNTFTLAKEHREFINTQHFRFSQPSGAARDSIVISTGKCSQI